MLARQDCDTFSICVLSVSLTQKASLFQCGKNRMNETVFQPGEQLPPSIDWWGFDSYAFTARSWEKPIAGYEQVVFPRLRPHQKVVATTGSLGTNRSALLTNRSQPDSNWSLEQFDEFCVENALRHLQWGLGDARVAMIAPWHFVNLSIVPGSAASDMEIGLVSLPRCAETYNAMGLLIRAKSNGTSPPLLPSDTPEARRVQAIAAAASAPAAFDDRWRPVSAHRSSQPSMTGSNSSALWQRGDWDWAASCDCAFSCKEKSLSACNCPQWPAA